MEKVFEIREHSQGVFDLTFCDLGIFTSSADNHVVLWDIEQVKQTNFVVKTSVPAYSLEATSDLLFIGLNNGDLHWVDIQSRQEIKYFTQHKSAIFNLLVDKINNKLISTDADGFVGVWDIVSKNLELFFQLPGGKIRTTTLNGDGSQLAIGSYDGRVYVFETNFYNELTNFFAHQDGVTAIAFHPINNYMITGGKDAHIRIWSNDGTEKIKAFPAHLYAIYGIEFSPCGRYFASGSRDKTIKIWNAESFEFIEKLDFKAGGHQHSVNAILWNDLGLFSVSDDRRLIFWRT
jgi:WD40 repeat protein